MSNDDIKFDFEKEVKNIDLIDPKDILNYTPMFQDTRIIRGLGKIKPILSLIDGKAIICGGMARYMVSNKEEPILPSDIDIYCLSEKDFYELKTIFDTKLFKCFESEGAISYSQEIYTNKESYNIQLIKPEVVKADEKAETVKDKAKSILSKFDFTICSAAILNDKEAICDEFFHLHDQHNRLVINYINCPVATTLRMLKYVKRGYQVHANEIIKCLVKWEHEIPDSTKQEAMALVLEYWEEFWDNPEAKEKIYSLLTFID